MRKAILGSAAAAAVVAATVYWTAMPERTLDRVRHTRAIRVGYVSEAPFAFPTPMGDVSGESPEIARVVLRRLGVARIEWVHTEFRSLIPELLAGRFDMIAAGMFVTPERARQIAFTTPTYTARAAFLVRRGDEERVGGYERVRDVAGARLALLAGAYEQRLAAAAGIPRSRTLIVPDATTGIEAVRSGQADAFAITAITARRLVREAGDASLTVVVLPDSVGGISAVGSGAYAFRPEDATLRDAFDVELRRFLGSRAHHALVRQFGFGAGDLPPGGDR